MTKTNKEREAFDAWWAKEGGLKLYASSVAPSWAAWQAARALPAEAQQSEPDMLWASDDVETPPSSTAEDFADSYASNGMIAGDESIVKVLCAKSMPDRQMLIRVPKDEDAPLHWEWIPAPFAAEPTRPDCKCRRLGDFDGSHHPLCDAAEPTRQSKPECDTCNDTGQRFTGHSGREDDGNAPEFERCPDCGYGEPQGHEIGALTDAIVGRVLRSYIADITEAKIEGICHDLCLESGLAQVASVTDEPTRQSGEAESDRIAALEKELADLTKDYDALRDHEADLVDQLRNKPRPARQSAEPVAPGFGLDEGQLTKLLTSSLKAEEINGEPATQHQRVHELLHWFARYADGHANGKWLAGHAFELAYYIAVNGVNRSIDVRAIQKAAYIEGVNIKPDERVLLERMGMASPLASPAEDSARLDWLIDDCAVVDTIVNADGEKRYQLSWPEYMESQRAWYRTARAAIDAQIAAAPRISVSGDGNGEGE